jgi:hypothetical protein
VKTAATEHPKATDVLVSITDQALTFHFGEQTLSLGMIVRMVSTASRTLHIRDLDERLEVENQATLVLAKRKGLVS